MNSQFITRLCLLDDSHRIPQLSLALDKGCKAWMVSSCFPIIMPAHSSFVSGNEKYASTFDKGYLAIAPTKKLLIGCTTSLLVDVLLIVSSHVHGCPRRVGLY